IHTGCYADAKPTPSRPGAGTYWPKRPPTPPSLGLKVNAGHGLTYHNVKAIAALPEMHELNPHRLLCRCQTDAEQARGWNVLAKAATYAAQPR
ncbi:pyridoxine 5'-phosphate synthase, partial [Klebsiella pneumoniae]|nr:pyridoxine 5'-phosphate synthase [Klebsiella pneumoniae]